MEAFEKSGWSQSLSRAVALERLGKTGEAELYYNEAERHLRAAIANTPADARLCFSYARLLEGRKRYDEAEIQYQKALDLDPEDETIRLNYQSMQDRRQRIDGLDDMLDETDAEKPLPPAFEPERATMPEVSPAPPVVETPAVREGLSREVDGYWALGVVKVEQGDLVSGEENFKLALDIAPRHLKTLKSYGSLLLNQKRYKEAEDLLAILMEIDPLAVESCLAEHPIDVDSSLLMLRGALYMRQGELEAAAPFLQQALEQEPEHVDWIIAYARLLVGLNCTPQAIDWLHKALASGLDDVTLHREYARLMSQVGQYDVVQQHLKRARDLDPLDPETQALFDELQPALKRRQAAERHWALACMKEREGFYAEAESLFQEAREIDGQHLPTLESYAQFLERRGRFSDAVQTWSLVAGNRPAQAEARLQAILNAQGEDPKTLNSLAQVLIQLDRQAEAEMQLRRSLDLAPGNLDALHLLVDLLADQARRRDAEALLANNLVTVETDPDLSLRYAHLLASHGDYDRAETYYGLARNLASDNEAIIHACEAIAGRIANHKTANTDMALGWMEAQEGKYDEAEQWYQQALFTDPEHVEALRRYAQLLEVVGRPMAASSYVTRLARIDPEAAEEHYRIHLPRLQDTIEGRCAYALFLHNLDRSAEAKEQFRLVLDSQPAYLPALDPYVDILLQEDEVRQAADTLKRALIQDDTLADIHWRYGNLLLDRRRCDLAGPYLARAADLSGDPDRKQVYEQASEKLDQIRKAELACALVFEGVVTDPDEVEASYREAYDACPDFVPMLLSFGEFLCQQGRYDEARRYLQEAAELDRYEDRAFQLLAELEAAQQAQSAPAVTDLAPGEENAVEI
jgi:tetratricopeptide (TPR) repeat protein